MPAQQTEATAFTGIGRAEVIDPYRVCSTRPSSPRMIPSPTKTERSAHITTWDHVSRLDWAVSSARLRQSAARSSFFLPPATVGEHPPLDDRACTLDPLPSWGVAPRVRLLAPSSWEGCRAGPKSGGPGVWAGCKPRAGDRRADPRRGGAERSGEHAGTSEGMTGMADLRDLGVYVQQSSSGFLPGFPSMGSGTAEMGSGTAIRLRSRPCGGNRPGRRLRDRRRSRRPASPGRGGSNLRFQFRGDGSPESLGEQPRRRVDLGLGLAFRLAFRFAFRLAFALPSALPSSSGNPFDAAAWASSSPLELRQIQARRLF